MGTDGFTALRDLLAGHERWWETLVVYECDECRAIVADTNAHNAWHGRRTRRVESIIDVLDLHLEDHKSADSASTDPMLNKRAAEWREAFAEDVAPVIVRRLRPLLKGVSGPSVDRIEKLAQALNMLCISAGNYAWGRDDDGKRQVDLEALRGDIQHARWVLTAGDSNSTVSTPSGGTRETGPGGSEGTPVVGSSPTPAASSSDDAGTDVRDVLLREAHEWFARLSDDYPNGIAHKHPTYPDFIRRLSGAMGRASFVESGHGVKSPDETAAAQASPPGPSQKTTAISSGDLSESGHEPGTDARFSVQLRARGDLDLPECDAPSSPMRCKCSCHLADRQMVRNEVHCASCEPGDDVSDAKRDT